MGGSLNRRLAAFQYAAIQGRRRAEEAAAVHRSANVVFRLQRGIADRANVGWRRRFAGNTCAAVKIGTGRQRIGLFGDGSTGHARAGKRTVRCDDDRIDTHFGVVGGVQAIGGGARKRNHAIGAVRAAIVNAHDNHPAISQVSYSGIAWDWQRRMRCG